MRTNFDASMAEVLKWEGGYVDHPKDPGGATNMGITIGTLRSWRRKPVTKADVKALSRREALDIYRANYGDPVSYDALPSGLDHVTLDGAINSGVSRGVKWLQQAVGAKADGRMGPNTLRAAQSAHVLTAIAKACRIRMGFLHGLSTFATFGKGWSRRVAEVEAFATKLAGGFPAVAAAEETARAQVKRETNKATGAVAGGAGSISLPDMPDWSTWAIAAAVVVMLVVIIGQRMHQKNRAAAFRAKIGG